MTSDGKAIIPVWTLATGNVRVPDVLAGDEPMTPERLTELRGVLAVLADEPIVTLEFHRLPDTLDRRMGMPLDAASPLAQHLSQLITQSARQSPVAASATATGEGLFRMVVPAKIAAQFGQGMVRSMPSKAASGGIYSAIRDSKHIVAHATFVPVSKAATAGGGVGAAVGAGVIGGTALTVAAPLVLMAVAVGMSAHAEHQRELAIEHITELLEQLHDQKLDDERSELDGCRDSIEKATAILLDQGRLGVSLGLDSAVYAINTALARADRRLAQWQSSLDTLSSGADVEVDALAKAFPGIDQDGGVFRAHLELAAFAIALKRRVIVLQAVDHAQLDPGNLFGSFTRELKADQQRLDELEASIGRVLARLSTIELSPTQGLRQQAIFMRGEVEHLMRAANRIHKLGDGVTNDSRATDVAIEIARNADGSVVVLPALPA